MEFNEILRKFTRKAKEKYDGEIIKNIEQVWKNYPHLRFFQFIEWLKINIDIDKRGITGDCFYTTDFDTLKTLKDIVKWKK